MLPSILLKWKNRTELTHWRHMAARALTQRDLLEPWHIVSWLSLDLSCPGWALAHRVLVEPRYIVSWLSASWLCNAVLSDTRWQRHCELCGCGGGKQAACCIESPRPEWQKKKCGRAAVGTAIERCERCATVWYRHAAVVVSLLELAWGGQVCVLVTGRRSLLLLIIVVVVIIIIIVRLDLSWGVVCVPLNVRVSSSAFALAGNDVSVECYKTLPSKTDACCVLMSPSRAWSRAAVLQVLDVSKHRDLTFKGRNIQWLWKCQVVLDVRTPQDETTTLSSNPVTRWQITED